jgi:hypothetical protein
VCCISQACAAVLDASCMCTTCQVHMIVLACTRTSWYLSMGSRLLSCARMSDYLLFFIMFMGSTAHMQIHTSTTLLWRHLE